MPNLIDEFERDSVTYLGLNVDGINAALVNAIQELEKRIKELEQK
jgi:hypothetical protein